MSASQSCRRCCVLGCPNRSSAARIGMHRVPGVESGDGDSLKGKSRRDLRSRWLRLAGLTESAARSRDAFICARHFLPNAYQHIDVDNKKVRRLKPDAVPSLFLPGQNVESEGKKVAVENSCQEDGTEGKTGKRSMRFDVAANEDDEGARISFVEENCQVVDDSAAAEMNGCVQDESVPAVLQDQSLVKNSDGDGSSSPLACIAPKDDAIVPVEAASETEEEQQPVLFTLVNNETEQADKDVSADDSGEKICDRRATVEQELVEKETFGSNTRLRGKTRAKATDGDSCEKDSPQVDGLKGKAGGKVKSNGRLSQSGALPDRASKSVASATAHAGGEAATAESEPTSVNTRRSSRTSSMKRINDVSLEKPGPVKRPAIDETKTQARMKYSPRKVDLVKSDSPSSSTSPPVLMDKRNVQLFLSRYGELIAQEVTQKLSIYGKAQTSMFNKMFDTVTAHSILMDRIHKDVSCRLNSCKYANSVRHAGVQVVSVQPVSGPRHSSVGSSVPQTSVTSQQQSSNAAQKLRPQQPQQQPAAGNGKALPTASSTSPRGRGRMPLTPTTPRMNASVPTSITQPRMLAPAAPTTPKSQAPSGSVIDLTDDEPMKNSLGSPAGRPGPASTRTAASPQNSVSPKKSTMAVVGAVPVGGIVPAGALRPLQPNSAQQPPRAAPVTAPTVMGGGGATGPPRPAAPTTVTSGTAVIHPRVTIVSTAQVPQRIRAPTALTTSAGQPVNVLSQPLQLVSRPPGPGNTPVVQLPPDIVMRPVQLQQPPQMAQDTNGSSAQVRRSSQGRPKHPAPLPPTPTYTDQGILRTPPTPVIQQIKRTPKGIVVTFDAKRLPGVPYAETEKYQVYSYVETNEPPSSATWNKVGEVGSLRLPMACTFTQFKDGHRIFFAVRGVDTTGRMGSFTEPKAIDLREDVIVL